MMPLVMKVMINYVWPLFFTCCAQETEVFLTPIDPTITRPQEIFIFYDFLHDLATIEYGK